MITCFELRWPVPGWTAAPVSVNRRRHEQHVILERFGGLFHGDDRSVARASSERKRGGTARTSSSGHLTHFGKALIGVKDRLSAVSVSALR